MYYNRWLAKSKSSDHFITSTKMAFDLITIQLYYASFGKNIAFLVEEKISWVSFIETTNTTCFLFVNDLLL
jgi:serine phosphatase RsbU (regulator of sigma subunit)